MTYPPGVGAGALWRIGSGQFVDGNEDGTVGGLAAAIAAVVAAGGGGIYMGPGLEAIPLVGFVSNTLLHQITNDGRYVVSGLRIADILDPTKRLYLDVSGIATGTQRIATIPNWSGYLLLPASLGTAGQFLRSGGAGVQPAFAALPAITNALLDGANHTDTQGGVATNGALIVRNLSGLWSAYQPNGDIGDYLVLVDDGGGGKTPVWSTGASASAFHNTLAHLKPFSVATCSVANGSNRLDTTTPNGFVNVRVGDFVRFNASTDASLFGAKVTGLVDSDSVDLSAANAGVLWTGTVLIYPGDHWEDSLTLISGTGGGYFITGGRGTFNGTGGTFQEIRGPVNWLPYFDGQRNDFRVSGSSSVASPYGFAITRPTTTSKLYFNVGNITADRVITILDSTDTMVGQDVVQTTTNKIMGAGTKLITESTGTYTVFRNVANNDRVTFDLSATPTALRSYTWPDAAGQIGVRTTAALHTVTGGVNLGTQTVTPPTGQMYRWTVYTEVTAVGTGSFQVNFYWTDGTRAETNWITRNMTVTTFNSGSDCLYLGAGTITYDTSGTWTGTCRIYVRVEAI